MDITVLVVLAIIALILFIVDVSITIGADTADECVTVTISDDGFTRTCSTCWLAAPLSTLCGCTASCIPYQPPERIR